MGLPVFPLLQVDGGKIGIQRFVAIGLTVRDKLGGKLQIQSGPGGTKAMFDFR